MSEYESVSTRAISTHPLTHSLTSHSLTLSRSSPSLRTCPRAAGGCGPHLALPLLAARGPRAPACRRPAQLCWKVPPGSVPQLATPGAGSPGSRLAALRTRDAPSLSGLSLSGLSLSGPTGGRWCGYESQPKLLIPRRAMPRLDASRVACEARLQGVRLLRPTGGGQQELAGRWVCPQAQVAPHCTLRSSACEC